VIEAISNLRTSSLAHHWRVQLENQSKTIEIVLRATCLLKKYDTDSEMDSQTAVAMNSDFCLIPTILCGGAGSRLWPVSRELQPKPFIRLSDGQSLLQKAYLRGTQLLGVKHMMTVTNRELLFKTEDEFREVNADKAPTSFILEPFGRNTAPAIASASIQIAKMHGPDAILLVLAADHLITDQLAFQNAVLEAINLAKQGKLVTFGIQPDSPETGSGYIESEGNTVLRFVEKPSIEKAKEYLASGRFLWNSGIFCFTAGSMLEQMEKHCPTILSATRACIEQSKLATGAGFSQLELDAIAFKNVPDDSIDYAVMEKSDQMAVVPCNIGWSDIGSWATLGELDPADANGNHIQGDTLLHDTRNCIVQSNNRLIGTVGVENLVIIDTPDALLIANKANVQDVKHIYAKLKAKDHQAHKLHSTVHRPWGTYTVLEEGNGFKIKRIEVKPGASLSLQMHHHRSEHWVVVSGSAIVVNGEKEIHLQSNQSTYIPACQKHRLINLGDLPCVMIEVQSGNYVGEDDIVRFEDIYGRT
jgi:mannose-1-phosphate guanylyltransferase